MKTLRIFISSPGDVRSERVRASDVVERLQTKFRAFVKLKPILWEHEAMRGTATFQAQIIPPSQTDIVICILWARIGMGLPQDYRRQDGTVPTGTEWEFEDAYSAFLAHGVPDLYVYRKTAAPTIEVRNDEDLIDWQQQKKALDRFLNHWFRERGRAFKAAFNSFETDEQFEKMLTQHLEEIINKKIHDAAGVVEEEPKVIWFEGSPFRGLKVFQREHASIFFGRDLDIRKVVDQLKAQRATGRAFLMIVGASGSGKSSLARAGVLPALMRSGEVEGVDCWRWLILRPGETTGGLVAGLAAALHGTNALPELADLGYNAQALATLLSDAPASAIPLIQAALARVGVERAKDKQRAAGLVARLIVIVDQFEEIFTLERVSVEERNRFLNALSALSRSGLAWVIVTMRSDLYAHCARSETLLALKGDDGQYDLSAPGFAELAQIIRLPARAAGITYEVDMKTHTKLDDALIGEAWKHPESLPLLQFTLDQLFEADQSKHGSNWNRVLTWQTYRDIGGLEGAIAKRAEDEYALLSADAKTSLPIVFGQLVALEGERANAQQARRSEFVTSPNKEEVVARFTAASLFVSSVNATGEPVIALAHEALLRRWPRLQQWVKDNQDFLEVRTRVDAELERWVRHTRRSAYLIPAGPLLKSAKRLVKKHRSNLTRREVVFVRKSSRHVFFRSWGGRLTMLGIIVLTLTILAISLLAGLVSEYRIKPMAYAPICVDYGLGAWQEKRGNKAEAIRLYQQGFDRAMLLPIPLTLRMVDAGCFDSRLELLLATNAPLPDDATLHKVHGWMEQYAEQELAGFNSYEPVIENSETMGRALKQHGRWADAVEYYDSRVFWLRKDILHNRDDTELQTKLCTALVDVGEARLQSNQTDVGRANLEEALHVAALLPPTKTDDEKTDALERLARIHKLLGDALTRTRDYAGALTHYAETVQNNRTLLAGHPDESIYRRRESSTALRFVALCQRSLKDWPHAEAAANEGIELARANFTARTRDETFRTELMLSFLNAASIFDGQVSNPAALEKAIDLCTEALTIGPNDVFTHSFRGYDYALAGKKEESRADFQFALQRDPQNLEALQSFGWALVVLGENRAALEPWATYLRLSDTKALPHDAGYLLIHASSGWIQGNQPQAIKDFQDLAKLNAAWQKPQIISDNCWPSTRSELVESIRKAAFPDTP